MKNSYEISRMITSMAKVIEYELSGASRVPLSAIDLEKKSISLGDLIADLIDILGDKKNVY